MSRNRKRQPDVQEDIVDEESKNVSTDVITVDCPHTKSFNESILRKECKKKGINSKCVDCQDSNDPNSPEDNNESNVSNKLLDAIDQSLWICLRCGYEGCGTEPNQHALKHYQKPHSDNHCLAIKVDTWDIWCYHCRKAIKPENMKKFSPIIEFLQQGVSNPKRVVKPKPLVKVCRKPTIETVNTQQATISNLPKVRGLQNLGNTCFFNSVLQCLAQTPFLVKILEDIQIPGQTFTFPGGKYKPIGEEEEEAELPPIEATLEKYGNFIPTLCKTLIEMQTSSNYHIKPKELLDSFRNQSKQCMDGEQHDSHELLRCLLDIVRAEDFKRYKNIILNKLGLHAKVNPADVDPKLKPKIKFYGNQVTASTLLGAESVFRGVLVCTVVCLNCHHSVHRKEPFLDLSLPVTCDQPQSSFTSNSINKNTNDTVELSNNNTSQAPSRHQLKKEKQASRKKKKHYRHNHNQDSKSIKQSEIHSDETKVESNSLESDADVEDNTEIENSNQKNKEPGYELDESWVNVEPEFPLANSIIALPYHDIHVIDRGNETINNSEIPPMDTTTNDRISNSPSPIDLSIISSHNRDTHEIEENGIDMKNSPIDTAEITDKFNSIKPNSLSHSCSSRNSSNSTGNSSSNSSSSEDSPTTTTPILNGNIHGLEKDQLNHNLDQLETSSNICTNLTNIGELMNHPENYQTQDDSCNGIDQDEFLKEQSYIGYPIKKGECSVESCLNQFTALEMMTGNNVVACEECTKRAGKSKESGKMVYTPSTIQYLLLQVPPVLILHLKRFQAHRHGVRKVTRIVKFSTLLDLAPICKNNEKSRLYSLYGVVVHDGGLQFGHYRAYVKAREPLKSDDPRWSFLSPKNIRILQNALSSDSEEEKEMSSTETPPPPPSPSQVQPPLSKWYHVSDSQVREVKEDDVLNTSGAYLLFYERIL